LATVLVVTSGKGGTGKTTTSASVGAGLALRGKKTVIIDFDIGLRNLDLIMGCESRIFYDFIDVIRGKAKVNQALIKYKKIDNLYILPASLNHDKDSLTLEGVGDIISELRDSFDYIICDSPAGIEQGAFLAMYFADEAIIVTNPEISSVRDSDRMLGILSSKSQRAEQNREAIKEYLLLNRYEQKRVNEGAMMKVDDINEILAIKLIGIVPESKTVLKSSNEGKPVILYEDSDAGGAYSDAVDRLLGGEVKYRFLDNSKKGFLAKFLK